MTSVRLLKTILRYFSSVIDRKIRRVVGNLIKITSIKAENSEKGHAANNSDARFIRSVKLKCSK
jgi:hypothetical protein